MKITTRQQAIESGQLYYFTGVACKHGHISKRYIRNSGCYECLHPTLDAPGYENISNRPISPAQQAKLDLQNRKLDIREKELSLKLSKKDGRLRNSDLRSSMVKRNFRIATGTYEQIRLAIWALARARVDLKLTDVDTGAKIQVLAKYTVYSFWIFADDEAAIREHLEVPLPPAGPITGTTARALALGEHNDMLDK